MAPQALLALDNERRKGGLFAGRAGRIASGVARGAQLLALGEMVMDKLPATPSRVSPMVLSGRVVSGAIAGAAVTPRARVQGALIGIAAAVGASYLLYALRRLATGKLRIPNLLAGLAEDALVLEAGARLAPIL